MNDEFETKDKQFVPFLLTQTRVNFLGTRISNTTIYFRFSPYSTCIELINAFVTRKADPVQPKNLLDAVESYRDVVFEMKEKMKNYG